MLPLALGMAVVFFGTILNKPHFLQNVRKTPASLMNVRFVCPVYQIQISYPPENYERDRRIPESLPSSVFVVDGPPLWLNSVNWHALCRYQQRPRYGRWLVRWRDGKFRRITNKLMSDLPGNYLSWRSSLIGGFKQKALTLFVRSNGNNDPRTFGVDDRLGVQQSGLRAVPASLSSNFGLYRLIPNQSSGNRPDNDQQYANNQGSPIHPISFNVDLGDCVDRYRWVGLLVWGCFWLTWLGVIPGVYFVLCGRRLIGWSLVALGMCAAVLAGVSGCWAISHQNACVEKEDGRDYRQMFHRNVGAYSQTLHVDTTYDRYATSDDRFFGSSQTTQVVRFIVFGALFRRLFFKRCAHFSRTRPAPSVAGRVQQRFSSFC